MSFLRDRAEEFLDNARYSLGKGYYNLTLFNVEQFIQLYAKYLIYLKAGDFPKTHNILSLLERIEDLYEDKCNISVFRRDNKDFLYVIYFSRILREGTLELSLQETMRKGQSPLLTSLGSWDNV